MGKGKKKDTDEPTKKRGNQGDFHGKRLEYLEGKLDEFREHSADKTTREWWPTLWADYWARFNWRLPLSEDPLDPPKPPNPPKLEPDATPANPPEPDATPVPKVLSEEDKAAKVKVMEDTEGVSAFDVLKGFQGLTGASENQKMVQL
jgi:hypothetical protein